MRSITRFVFAAAMLLVALPDVAESQKRKQRDVISALEIDSSAFTDRDAFDMIKSLRPHFFERPKGVRTMGNSNVAGLLLVVDNVRQTDILGLKSMRATDIQEARYLDPDKSQDEFGAMYNGGAIVIKSRKSEK
jgi:hypothetical protein